MKLSQKDPAGMTAGAINREIDRLMVIDSALIREFIAAGRGHERPSEYLSDKYTDDLSRRAQALYARRFALFAEVERRAGPGWHRIPSGRGFGPRVKGNPTDRHDQLIRDVYATRPDRLHGIRLFRRSGMTYATARKYVDEIHAHAPWWKAHFPVGHPYRKAVAAAQALVKREHVMKKARRTKTNPHRRPAKALVVHQDGARRFYAVQLGPKIGWTSSHAMATPFLLSHARGLQVIARKRGYAAELEPV